MRELFELSTNLELTDTEVRTPPALVEEMLDRLPSAVWGDPNARFLDPCAGTGTFVLSIIGRLMRGLGDAFPDRSERAAHILANQVWAYDVCLRQVRRLRGGLRKLGVEHLARNVYNCNVLEQEFDMKFDVIVGNPPYQAGLHLKFLQKSIENCVDNGQVIFIHPSEWLVQKRQDYSSKRIFYKKMRNESSEHSVSIRFIDNPFGKSAAMFVPLGITHVIKNNANTTHLEDARTKIYGDNSFQPVNHNIAHLDEATAWFDGKLENSIVSKFFKKSKIESWKNHLRKNYGNQYLSLSLLTGNGYTTLQYEDGNKHKISNFYSLGNSTSLEITSLPKVAKPQGTKTIGNAKPWFSFDNQQEAENALHFIMQNRLIRAYIAIIKIDQHASDALLHLIPWFDWKEPMNEEKLAQEINLSKDEVNYLLHIFNTISV